MEKKLKVKPSDFKSNLTYNEWVKAVNFGRDYIAPTKYYMGNVTRHPDLFQSVDHLFPKVSLTEKILRKFKNKIKQNG